MTNTREIPAITLTSSAFLLSSICWDSTLCKSVSEKSTPSVFLALLLRKFGIPSTHDWNVRREFQDHGKLLSKTSLGHLNTVLSPPLKGLHPKNHLKMSQSASNISKIRFSSCSEKSLKLEGSLVHDFYINFSVPYICPEPERLNTCCQKPWECFILTFIFSGTSGRDSLRALKFLRDGNLDSGIFALPAKQGQHICCLQYFTPWLIIWSGWR